MIGFPIDTVDSTAIDTLTVNPITGKVAVRFQRYPTRTPYIFKVSRRAALALTLNSDRSLGQWVNRHCLQSHRTLTA
jgi:hypothetical protein